MTSTPVLQSARATYWLGVLFSWKGVFVLLTTSFVAMLFHAPWCVFFLGVAYIGFWVRLTKGAGMDIRMASKELGKRLLVVDVSGKFFGIRDRFRVRASLVLVLFITLGSMADVAKRAALEADAAAGGPISQGFSTFELIATQVPLLTCVIDIAISFALMQIFLTLARHAFLIERNEGVKRISGVVAVAFFLYGELFIDASWLARFVSSLIFSSIGLIAIMLIKWIALGFISSKAEQT